MEYTKKDLINLTNEIEIKTKVLINENLGDKLLKQVEIEKFLINEAYLKIENKLKNISENYGIDTADYTQLNELNGVSFKYDISDFYKELLNEYTSEILDASFEIFQDSYYGYFNKKDKTIEFNSCEDAFLTNDWYLIYLDKNIKVKNFLDALVSFEMTCIEKGQCGALYKLDYYDNISYFNNFLPNSLKAFQEDDKKTLNKLEFLKELIDLDYNFNNGENFEDNIFNYSEMFLKILRENFKEIKENGNDFISIINFKMNTEKIENNKIIIEIELEFSEFNLDKRKKINIDLNEI